MSNDVTKFFVGDTITANEFNKRSEDIETFINGNIEQTDLYDGQCITTHMIRPQKFFGSPAPRSEGVSGDIHYRRMAGADASQFFMWQDIRMDEYVVVSGLAKTIHVVPQEHGQQVFANVMCSFYAREVNEGDSKFPSWDASDYPEQYRYCDFTLFVKRGNGPAEKQRGTRRVLYVNGRPRNNENRFGAKNLSMFAKVRLDHGVNHIYVGVNIITPTANKEGLRLHVAHRTMVTDVKYL